MNAKAKEKTEPAPETMSFSADVARLLDIVANALYTNHDVFLRELISNGADACDRLRYEAIARPELTKDDPDFKIHIFKDTEARTLTVIDNGIGMNRDELVENLGTIAKSGTAALMEQVKQAGDQKDRLSLIGQFGVGFYACYMVASKATVISRRAGDKQVWAWESDGRSGFSVRKATKEESAKIPGARGTAIVLDIKDEGCDFLLDEKIDHTIKLYSDHIDVPIYLGAPDEVKEKKKEPSNAASALWVRPKNEITKEQYTQFYKHISHGFDEPLMTSHWRAEGKIEYTALLFIPTMRPWDLYDPGRRHAVKLYVRRVFISDDLEGLMYPWLRFLRGVIDSADLPLNISRESLQFNPVVSKIRSSVTKRILSDLDKLAREDEFAFITFWAQFGAAIKEGLYDAPEHREAIFKICRFYSTFEDGEKFTTLDEYVERMKDGQENIYYISGEKLDNLKASPQLEGFRERGIEVLYFTDTIDDFWLQQAMDYKGKPFRSVTKGDIDLDKAGKTDEKEEKKDKKEDGKFDTLIALMKKRLEEDIGDVRLSRRLTTSPVCLVAPDHGVDMHMERVLKIHQKYQGGTKPVLEINPGHPLIEKLAAMAEKDAASESLSESIHMLQAQAQILQGLPVSDTAGFTRRLSELMLKGF